MKEWKEHPVARMRQREQKREKEAREMPDQGSLAKRAKHRALYLLERADRTEQELRSKLEKTYEPEIVEEAIAYVRQYHYIDDKRYAANYLGSRGKLKSRRQVEQELLYKKGVAKDVLEEVFSEAEPQDERAMIRRWMEKKRMDPQTATREELRKFYLFLARRGFQSEDILHELRRQNGEIPQAE